MERYQRILCGRVRHSVAHLEAFLCAVRCGCLEHFAADVLGKAIRTWRRGRGTKFSTWLYGILSNDIISGQRRRKPPLQPVGEGGRDLLGDIEAPGGAGRGIERLALAEGVDLARACLRAMDARRRRVFVWAFMLGMSNEEIRGIWPHESAENIKQIKHRSAAQFLSLWQGKGGGSAQEIYQTLSGAMAEKVDPGEIRDPRARRAYRLWVKKGSLAAAAREMRVAVPRLRRMILGGLEEIFEQVFRGGAAGPGDPGKWERELARYLSLAEGERPGSPLVARLGRTLDFVRAAFGFAPREAAAETLGSRLQSHLRKEEDYDRACRELGLGAAGLRELLADEGEPGRALLGRLSRFMGVPAARLRALPRRPEAEASLPLRSGAGFEEERFRERVMEWIEGKSR